VGCICVGACREEAGALKRAEPVGNAADAEAAHGLLRDHAHPAYRVDDIGDGTGDIDTEEFD